MVVNADECLRGWLALVAKATGPERESSAYDRLNLMIDLCQPRLSILPFVPVVCSQKGRPSASATIWHLLGSLRSSS